MRSLCRAAFFLELHSLIMLTSLADSILSLVYPQPCAVCGRSVEYRRNGVACENCWMATRVFSGSETLCSKCGAYLLEKPSRRAVFCPNCTEHFYDSSHAIGVYEKALAASILELKRDPFIPDRLRNYLRSALDRIEFTDATIIVPVPLSARRRLERGFNQAETIASIISSETVTRLEKDVLQRSVHTAIHRVAMDKKAREMSVAKAFNLVQPEKILGKDVLLVDDVMTSGATVSACAKILKKGGAQKVRVLTLGRAVLR